MPRIPKLLPILTAVPDQATQLAPDQATGGQQVSTGLEGARVGGTASSSSTQAHTTNTAATRGRRRRPPPLSRGALQRSRYYLRLYMNGHYVDASQPVMLGEDYTLQFKDVFRRVVATCRTCLECELAVASFQCVNWWDGFCSTSNHTHHKSDRKQDHKPDHDHTLPAQPSH